MQQPVKLVHVTTVPLTLFFLSGQVNYLKSQGYNVHAIASPDEALDRFARQERITVYGIPMPRRITPISDLLAVFRMARLLRRLKPHIVHSHTPKGGFIGMISAWLARVPVRIYHIHGFPHVTASGWKRRLLMTSERVSCRLAHRVLSVSHSAREQAIIDGLCAESKIKVLHNGSINGVDALGRFNPEKSRAQRDATREKIGIPRNAMVIAFVGRIARDKGIVELVDAWSVLREEFADVHLLVVGPFETNDAIPAHTQEALRTDPRVHLVGLVWNMPAMFAASDLVVLPTYREGFPVVPLEAAAMSLPVIATSVPGCTDAIQDGVTGILVPPRNSQELSDAIRVYLTNDELRLMHGRAARNRVLAEFRPIDIWSAISKEYSNALDFLGEPATIFSVAKDVE